VNGVDWISTYGSRLQPAAHSSFASDLLKGKAAVAAALTQSWSNGQTEGQITRPQLLKRQAFGRAKLDLLEARMIGAP